MTKSKLLRKVQRALELDSRIAADKSNLDGVGGSTTEYMGYLGLNKHELKSLEHNGLALRGYHRYRAKTHLGRNRCETRVMWVLLGDSK